MGSLANVFVMTVSNHLKHKVISGKPIKTLFSGKESEEHDNGPRSAQQKLHVAATPCEHYQEPKKADVWINSCKRAVKPMYAVLRNGGSQGVQTAPMCKILQPLNLNSLAV